MRPTDHGAIAIRQRHYKRGSPLRQVTLDSEQTLAAVFRTVGYNPPGHDILGVSHFFCGKIGDSAAMGFAKCRELVKNLRIFMLIDIFHSFWYLCCAMFHRVADNHNRPPLLFHIVSVIIGDCGAFDVCGSALSLTDFP